MPCCRQTPAAGVALPPSPDESQDLCEDTTYRSLLVPTRPDSLKPQTPGLLSSKTQDHRTPSISFTFIKVVTFVLAVPLLNYLSMECGLLAHNRFTTSKEKKRKNQFASIVAPIPTSCIRRKYAPSLITQAPTMYDPMNWR